MNDHPSATAVITGGTSGIGLATAQLLNEQGYQVLVTGQNPVTLDAAKRALPEDVIVFRADSRSLSDVASLATEVEARLGHLGLLYLNAGTSGMFPIETVDEKLFDDFFDTNLKGQYFTLQKLLPFMSEGSSVVFNSALSARLGVPNYSLYSATKGAVEAMTRALAAELAPRKIRVNCIIPGPIETPAISKLGLQDEALKQFREVVTSKTLLARFGSSAEVARAISFLASPAASYITGTNLTVDGGMGIAL